MNRLAHIALVVRDYDEALAFYVGKLGFTLVEDKPVPEQRKRWVTIRPPGAAADATTICQMNSDRLSITIVHHSVGAKAIPRRVSISLVPTNDSHIAAITKRTLTQRWSRHRRTADQINGTMDTIVSSADNERISVPSSGGMTPVWTL